MKKDKAELSKEPSDRKAGTVRRRSGARAPQREDDSLTCSEAQVEALLSEGEST